jgi:ribonuclease HI
MSEEKKKVSIYCDGACSGNPGPGGWGVVLGASLPGGRTLRRYISGYEPDTTNNRMEIKAAIESLKALKTACDVTIHSDSQYLINTVSKGWARRKNQDLWQELDTEASRHTISWVWVKGHSSNAGNEIADLLATKAIQTKTGEDRRES